VTPLPTELTTPPVMKMYLVFMIVLLCGPGLSGEEGS